jgi:hypothetical protein
MSNFNQEYTSVSPAAFLPYSIEENKTLFDAGVAKVSAVVYVILCVRTSVDEDDAKL